MVELTVMLGYGGRCCWVAWVVLGGSTSVELDYYSHYRIDAGEGKSMRGRGEMSE